MIFNYKRVSTIDQNTERQLLDIACDREYVEKIRTDLKNYLKNCDGIQLN